VLIKFRVRGALRYICHAEMLKVFQRACARAGIKIQHSQGFNPHPRLSLPLPRPVGVESDDELLCLRVERGQNEPQALEYESLIRDKLSAQLPDGCELLSVEATEAKSTPQPFCVTYILSLRPEYADDRLKEKIKHLLERKDIIVERKIDAEKLKFEDRISKIKKVDVRPFLESVEWDNRSIVMKCNITYAGSIRVDEILKLLEIDVEKLTAPIKRTNVQWQEPENRRQNLEDRR